MRESLMVPDKTIILHWNESQNAWMELPWEDWVRFRGVGYKEPRSLAGAKAGEHYFLVCMLGRQGELRNVIPHRYLVSKDALLVHGFDGLEPIEREEAELIEEMPFPTKEDIERLNELIGRGFSVNLPPLHTIQHSLRTIPGLAGAVLEADCWNFLSAIGVCRASGKPN